MRAPAWLLPMFLISSLLIVCHGLALRFAPVSFESALRELRDGDADRGERIELTRLLRDHGRSRHEASDDVRSAVIAAMAAAQLEDLSGYRTIARRLQGHTTLIPGGRPRASGEPDSTLLAWIDAASLGEPYLRDLLAATDASHRGNRARAAELFARARRSARLHGAELARLLAGDGLGRIAMPR